MAKNRKACRAKTPYETIEAARAAFAQVDLTQLNPPNSIYRCPTCKQFHLTSTIGYRGRTDKGGFTGHNNRL